MLPFLNLTSSEFISPDALKGAGGLVPEALDALEGGFASVLQSQVIPARLLQAPAGEGLPLTGNALPLALAADELPLDSGIELKLDAVDLSSLGLDVAMTSGDAEVTTPAIATDTAISSIEPELAPDGVPVAIHVPPQPVPPDGDGVTVPAAADTAADGSADALAVPLVAPAASAMERGARAETRDRALDAAALQQRTAPVAHDPAVSTRVHVTQDGDLRNPSRSDAANEARTPPLTARPEPAVVAAGKNRTVAELSASREDAPRVVRDDALPLPRPVQPAPWQQGTIVADAAPEPSQRILTELTAAMPRAASPVVTPLPVTAQTIDVPVQQSGWDNLLADRVTMMANGRVQNAELRLTPAELGPLRIQLEIDDGVANVSFQSQHPVTREALEQAMPRLRELLAENGLSLGQADVRDESSQQRSRETGAEAALAGDAAAADVDDPTTPGTARRTSDSLVDTFA